MLTLTWVEGGGRTRVVVTCAVVVAEAGGLIRGSVSQMTPRGSQLHLLMIVLVLY